MAGVGLSVLQVNLELDCLGVPCIVLPLSCAPPLCIASRSAHCSLSAASRLTILCSGQECMLQALLLLLLA